MSADHATERSTVQELIEAQRKCSKSPNPYQRVVGSLLLAARLQERLAALADEEVGQLMFDVVWNEVNLLSPEMTICRVATLRLIKSSSVVKTIKENVNQ